MLWVTGPAVIDAFLFPCPLGGQHTPWGSPISSTSSHCCLSVLGSSLRSVMTQSVTLGKSLPSVCASKVLCSWQDVWGNEVWMTGEDSLLLFNYKSFCQTPAVLPSALDSQAGSNPPVVGVLRMSSSHGSAHRSIIRLHCLDHSTEMSFNHLNGLLGDWAKRVAFSTYATQLRKWSWMEWFKVLWEPVLSWPLKFWF